MVAYGETRVIQGDLFKAGNILVGGLIQLFAQFLPTSCSGLPARDFQFESGKQGAWTIIWDHGLRRPLANSLLMCVR